MFDLLYDLANEMDKAFAASEKKGYKRSFACNVLEGENEYQVVAQMPGFNKEDINVTFEDGTLTISATHPKAESKADEKTEAKPEKRYLLKERADADLERALYFGDIEEEAVSAKYENGLLYVTIALKKPEEKVKKTITIE